MYCHNERSSGAVSLAADAQEKPRSCGHDKKGWFIIRAIIQISQNVGLNICCLPSTLDRPHTTRFLSCDGSDRI